jgi:DNA-binding NarL/FixJ family response regulator
MSNILVLIRDAPTKLREILERAITNEPDMALIPEPAVPTQAPDCRSLSPDVVIVGASDSEPAERARALLEQWPGSHAFMITAGGHRVFRYKLLPQGVDLGEMSPSQVVEAIRSAIRTDGEPHAH